MIVVSFAIPNDHSRLTSRTENNCHLSRDCVSTNYVNNIVCIFTGPRDYQTPKWLGNHERIVNTRVSKPENVRCVYTLLFQRPTELLGHIYHRRVIERNTRPYNDNNLNIIHPPDQTSNQGIGT